MRSGRISWWVVVNRRVRSRCLALNMRVGKGGMRRCPAATTFFKPRCEGIGGCEGKKEMSRVTSRQDITDLIK